jgi:hypothetical protein
VENNADTNATDNQGRNAVSIGIYERKLLIKFYFLYLKKQLVAKVI